MTAAVTHCGAAPGTKFDMYDCLVALCYLQSSWTEISVTCVLYAVHHLMITIAPANISSLWHALQSLASCGLIQPINKLRGYNSLAVCNQKFGVSHVNVDS